MAIHAYTLDAASKVDDLPTTPNAVHFLAFVADHSSADTLTKTLGSLWPTDAELGVVISPTESAFENVYLQSGLPVMVAMFGLTLLASTNDCDDLESFIADVKRLSEMMPGSPA